MKDASTPNQEGNASFSHLLQHLHALGLTPHPPATPADLSRVEQMLGLELPTPVRDLYLTLGGLDGPQQEVMWCRLHDLSDIAPTLNDLNAPLHELAPRLVNYGIPLFNDGGDNYLVFTLLPECPGRLVYSTSGDDFSPEVLFRSLHEPFFAHWLEGELILPQGYQAQPAQTQDDERAHRACLMRAQQCTGYEAHFFESLAAGLAPPR
ncbi:SMI1/KNR4 family protein [Deinococcus sp. 14RED07]|uniref:SMI1/KNR4 family protein n=1 Tax=Deinococcus sp. 14RED07 TaxID=2745874 RepID=UPI0021066187|nr:SMI1/KNR4 family protein [Deinococcus sp. 14RED07]